MSQDHIVNRLIRINIINIKNKFGTTLPRWVREHTFLKQRFVGRPVGGTLDATETDLTVTQLWMVLKNTGGLRRVQAPLKIAPFGKEDTATELTKHAERTQDTLVEAVENAEVAEVKRAVFRALTVSHVLISFKLFESIRFRFKEL